MGVFSLYLLQRGLGGFFFGPQNLTCALYYETSDPETIGEILNKGDKKPDLEESDGREVKQSTTDEVIDF